MMRADGGRCGGRGRRHDLDVRLLRPRRGRYGWSGLRRRRRGRWWGGRRRQRGFLMQSVERDRVAIFILRRGRRFRLRGFFFRRGGFRWWRRLLLAESRQMGAEVARRDRINNLYRIGEWRRAPLKKSREHYHQKQEQRGVAKRRNYHGQEITPARWPRATVPILSGIHLLKASRQSVASGSPHVARCGGQLACPTARDTQPPGAESPAPVGISVTIPTLSIPAALIA